MKRLTSIVATNQDGAIGVGNRLPWRVKSDLRFFKNTTLGHVVIMGRRTFDSLGKKPLPGRTNIVLSHFSLFPTSDFLHCAVSVDEALTLADNLSSKKSEVFVVGGAQTYAQFCPYVDRYLVTLIEKRVTGADTFLDDSMFGSPEDWDYKILDAGQTDEDECPFEIVEMLRQNGALSLEARSTAISNYRAAYGGASRRLRRAHSRVYA